MQPTDDYQTLIYCQGDPVFIVKNQEESKVGVMAFSLNKGDAAISFAFPVIIYNMFNYFFPSTLKDYSFIVGEDVTFNARANSIDFNGGGLTATYTNFPTTLNLAKPGTYTLTQIPIDEEVIIDNFFVRVDPTQSNFAKVEDRLANPAYVEVPEPENLDIIFYLAAILVTLLFLEWWLQIKENY